MSATPKLIDWQKNRRAAFVDAFRDLFGGLVIGGVVITALGAVFGFVLGPLSGIFAFAAAAMLAAGLAGPVAWKRQLASARLELGAPLDLDVTPREAKQPPKWGGAYRVDVRVENRGSKARLQAKMRTVRGTLDTDYSSFLLQWDIVDQPDIELFQDDSHYLHLLWTKDRELRFLGPERSPGKGPTIYKTFKAAGDIWFQFEIRDINSGRFKVVECNLSFDQAHAPSLEVLGVKNPEPPATQG